MTSTKWVMFVQYILSDPQVAPGLCHLCDAPSRDVPPSQIMYVLMAGLSMEQLYLHPDILTRIE